MPSNARKESHASRRPDVVRPIVMRLNSGSSSRVWAIVALFLAALGLRAWSVASLARNPRIADPILDSRYYLDVAGMLARGEGWPESPHFFSPLYPFVLSGLVRIAGPSVLAIQIVQSLLGCAALAFLLLAARRWLGVTAAVLAGLLYVLYGPVLGMENLVLMESILLCLACAALWLWPDARSGARTPALVRAFAFGLVCGLLAVGRGTFLLLPLSAIAGLWLFHRHEGPGKPWHAPARGVAHPSSTRDRALVVGLIIIGVCLPLLPQTISQTRATGRLQIMTLNSGLNLYVGHNPTARGIFSEPSDLDLNQDPTGVRSAALLTGKRMTLVEASRYWRERAASFVRERPGRELFLIARKSLLYFSPREVPQVDDFQILAESSPPLRVAFLRFGILLPFVLLGAATLFLRSGQAPAIQRAAAQPRSIASLHPWLALVCTGWIQTVLFFATGRYRIPIVPGFLGLAAVGALFVWHRAPRMRAIALACAAAAGVALQLLPPAYPADKARAFDAFQMGVRHMKAGQLPLALADYDAAIRFSPASGEAWHSRGVVLYHLRRNAEAVTAYREALARMPGSAITWYALALACRDGGDDAGALAAFERAVQLDPRQAGYRVDFGDALVRAGKTEEAIEQWNITLQIQPGYPDALQRLRAMGVAPDSP